MHKVVPEGVALGSRESFDGLDEMFDPIPMFAAYRARALQPRHLKATFYKVDRGRN